MLLMRLESWNKTKILLVTISLQSHQCFLWLTWYMLGNKDTNDDYQDTLLVLKE